MKNKIILVICILIMLVPAVLAIVLYKQQPYGMQSEISKTAFNYLGEALEIKYGSPSNDTSPVLDVIYLMGVQIDEATLSMLVSASVAKYKVWKPDEENNIVLLYFNSDEEVTTLFYIQPSSEVPEKDYNFDGL